MSGVADYPEFLQEWRDERDFVECRTSGSTGRPKQIHLPKAMMAESAMRTVRFFNIAGNSHLHSCISPEFIGGKMMAVRAELMGANLSWEVPSNRPLTNYSDGDIDLLAVVPSQMIDIVDRIDLLPKIHAIIVGGAPIPVALRQKIEESGLNAWETYGMTETASHIALRRILSSTEPFIPLPGINVSADSDSRLIIDLGRWGKICTNDIVEIDFQGRFNILGRADSVIITGGKKVHPEQVEPIIESLIGAEVILHGVPDEKWGQKVVLTVEPTVKFSEFELMEICRRELPLKSIAKECIPKEIIIAPLPRTSNDKKLRRCQNP